LEFSQKYDLDSRCNIENYSGDVESVYIALWQIYSRYCAPNFIIISWDM